MKVASIKKYRGSTEKRFLEVGSKKTLLNVALKTFFWLKNFVFVLKKLLIKKYHFNSDDCENGSKGEFEFPHDFSDYKIADLTCSKSDYDDNDIITNIETKKGNVEILCNDEPLKIKFSSIKIKRIPSNYKKRQKRNQK